MLIIIKVNSEKMMGAGSIIWRCRMKGKEPCQQGEIEKLVKSWHTLKQFY